MEEGSEGQRGKVTGQLRNGKAGIRVLLCLTPKPSFVDSNSLCNVHGCAHAKGVVITHHCPG